MSTLPTLALLMATLGLATVAGAASSSNLGSQDQSFAQTLAAANYAEIDTAKMAKHKTSNDQVEAFAKQMIDDHEKNNKKLKKMAKDLNVDLPSGPDDDHKAMADRLKQTDSGSFDKAYINNEVTDHEKVIEVLKQEIQEGQDASMKALANDTLPVVESHLTMAKALATRLGGGQ